MIPLSIVLIIILIAIRKHYLPRLLLEFIGYEVQVEAK